MTKFVLLKQKLDGLPFMVLFTWSFFMVNFKMVPISTYLLLGDDSDWIVFYSSYGYALIFILQMDSQLCYFFCIRLQVG